MSAPRPVRVQRTRKKGGGIPGGAVYVGRPSKWGNPFHTHGDGHPMAPEIAVSAFRAQFFGPRADGSFFPNDHPRFRTHNGKRQMEVRELTTVEDIRRELRGKNLACWGPLVDKDGHHVPCHADVLLEIANADE